MTVPTQLSREEKLNFYLHLARKAPILYWAEKKFNWRPKHDESNGRTAWYQSVLAACFDGVYRYPDDWHDEDLRGKPIRKFAWRIGRQCIPEGSIIHTRDGHLVPIEEHPDSWVTMEQGEVLHIQCEGGYELRATANHNVPVYRDGKEIKLPAGQLKIGDELTALISWDKWGNGVVPYEYDKLLASGRFGKLSDGEKWEKHETKTGEIVIDNDLAELLGWLVADGNVNYAANSGAGIYFKNTNLNYINRVKELAIKYFPEINVNQHEHSPIKATWKTSYSLTFTSINGRGKSKGQNSLKEFIRAMDFHPCGFPRAVAKYFTKEQVCAFMRGLWAGDGNVYIKEINEKSTTYEMTLACSLNRTYAEYCCALLNKLGVKFKIQTQTGKLATAPFYLLKGKNKTILNNFRDIVGNILEKPIPAELGVYAIDKRFKHDKFTVANDGEEFKLVKIKSIIVEEKKQRCYDVEYVNKGWFVNCGGLRIFNSGKTELLSLGALYLGICKPIKFYKTHRYKNKETGAYYTKKIEYIRGAKIIMASADADKAKTIFDRVMRFINDCPEFQAALEAKAIELKLHPFPQLKIYADGWTEPAEITFRGPGANGQALRSKTFDYKLYDEADYMPNAFFEAERATNINAGDTALTILSSTPSGRRDYFYRACFVAGTMVQTIDGPKPIEEIQIGDMVINRHGLPEPVTRTRCRAYKHPLVSLMTTFNDEVITATSGHKFMALRKKTRYCYICRATVWKTLSPCVGNGKHRRWKPLQPEYLEARRLAIGDYLVIPSNQIDKKKVPHSYSNEKFTYVPITSKVITDNPQLVYNLTVGDDHSYLANYYGVANCTDPKLNFEEFHFPSWENPSYTPQLDREFRQEYNQTTYEHEILADWGTVEFGVFDWTYFVNVFSYSYKPGSRKGAIYRAAEYTRISLTANDINKLIGHNNIGAYLKQRLPERNPLAKYWFGADLGYTSDPSEFLIFEEYNGVMKLVVRIHMEHVTYDIQADMIALLDTHFLFNAMGMDRGNAGESVYHSLTTSIEDSTGYNKFKLHDFATRMIPVQFGQSVELGKIKGERDRVPVKEWMTGLIIKQAEMRLLIMPGVDYDDEIENQFRNHTYNVGANGAIIYSKSGICPDHIVDAARTAFFARSYTKLPKKRAWPVGNVFKSSGGGGWR